MKKDSLERIHSNMEFIIGWLARPEMKKRRMGFVNGRVIKPQYAKLEDRGFMVNKAVIVECRNLTRRLKKLKK